MFTLVTSFDKRIYDISGSKLIYSYIKNVIKNKNIQFHIFTEGIIDININREDIFFHKIEDSDYFNKWILNNKKIIPIKYNGICEKPLPYFNHRASLFFRKVASLYEAYNLKINHEKIIWLDADIIISSEINYKFINNYFNNNYELYYFQGSYRRNYNRHLKDPHKKKGIESCLLIFNKEFNILNEWINFYESDFLKYNRWDDGWILKIVLENTKYKSLDIGGNLDNPLAKSELAEMFLHNKGLHNITIYKYNNYFNQQNIQYLFRKIFLFIKNIINIICMALGQKATQLKKY